MVHYIRYPVPFFVGLSQIGGFLAVFKLSLVVLCFANKRQFMMAVKSFLGPKELVLKSTNDLQNIQTSHVSFLDE
jgi:hypothetical protein